MDGFNPREARVDTVMEPRPMSDMFSVPANIPGLIRKTSPVVCVDPDACEVEVGAKGIVFDLPKVDRVVMVWTFGDDYGDTSYVVGRECVALDLSDATGRVHAAWWLSGHAETILASFGMTWGEYGTLIDRARSGRDMSVDQIRLLQAFVLHVDAFLRKST